MVMLRIWCVCLGLLLWVSPVQATVDWDESFEYADNAALVSTWASSCLAANMPGTMEISTTLVHSGSKSLKLTYPPPDSEGGCFIDRFLTAGGDTLYTRFWINMQNFTVNSVGTKVTFHGNNGIYPSFWWGLPNGTTNLGVSPQAIYQPDGTFPTINIFGGAIPQNQWACVETQITMSSPGLADGIIREWINGVQTINDTTQYLRAPVCTPVCSGCASNCPNANFTFVRMYRQHGVGTIYYDDYAVSRDARIGCGGIPTGDTTPPNPVTGLAVSTAGAATWNATTDNTGGTGLASYTLLRCTGTCTPTVTLVQVGPSTLSYNDLSVIAGTTYSYAIKATDLSGNSTAQSATVTMTAAATTRTLLATYTPSGSGADLGATWDPGYTGKNAYKLSSSTIQATVVNTDSMETYNGIATPNDQWAQNTLTAFGGTHPQVTCVVLRSANAATLNAYLVCALKNAGNGLTTLIQNLNGTTNPVLVSESATAWASGDYIRGEIQGTTLKAIRGFGSSESVILSVSDTTYSAGKAGLLTYISTGGALTDIQLGAVTIGGFAASSPPAIATVTNVTRTQATVTWDLTTVPTNIRVWTGNAPVATVTAPLSSFPSGVYTYPPTILNGLTDYICFIAQDSGGNEVANSQKCAAVPAAPIDTAPPVVTLSAPTGILPAGTTSTTIAVTLDKPSTCKYDTTDTTYALMANSMTTASLTASATVSGLTDGSVHTYYVRCDFVDTLGVEHPNLTSLSIPVTVAAASDLTPPVRSGGAPSGTLAAGTTSVSMQLTTNENATCKYGTTAGVAYASIASTFTTGNGTTAHSQTIGSLTDGSTSTYYIRCQDTATNANADDFIITWSITSLPPDVTPPTRSTPAPVGTLAAGTTSTTMSLTTDENATCKYGLAPSVSYASLPSTFSTTGTTTHSVSVTGLTDNTTYTRYIKCQDVSGNANTDDFLITWAVAVAPGDTTKPSTVTGNSCSAISPTQVSCTWNAATDNVAVAGYRVLLSYGASNTTYILIASPTAAAYIITDVLSSTVVNVVVDAVDTSGNVSAAHSNVSTVTTPAVPDTTPPSTMTNLRIVGTFQSSVLLTWDTCTDNSGSCITIIEQSPAGCAAFSQIKSQLSLTQLIVSLSAGTDYCFRGIFSDGTNLSLAYSNVLQVTTPSIGLGAPRATIPFGVTRDSVTRSSAGTRTVRP